MQDCRRSREPSSGVERAVLDNRWGAGKPENPHLAIISTGCWAGWRHLTKCLFFDTSITTHFLFSCWLSCLCYPTDWLVGSIIQTHLRTCRLTSWYYITVCSYPTFPFITRAKVKLFDSTHTKLGNNLSRVSVSLWFVSADKEIKTMCEAIKEAESVVASLWKEQCQATAEELASQKTRTSHFSPLAVELVGNTLPSVFLLNLNHNPSCSCWSSCLWYHTGRQVSPTLLSSVIPHFPSIYCGFGKFIWS